MSPLATTFTGASWDGIRSRLIAEAEQINGRIEVSGVPYPRLTRAAGLAILQAFRKLRRAWKLPAGIFWPELWYSLLGYEKPGDRFIMTTAHAMGPADATQLEAIWVYVDESTQELERKKAQPLMVVLDLTFAAYERTANEAYTQLKEDRRRATIPSLPTPPGVPRPPPIDVPVPAPGPPLTGPPLPSLRGAGILLALIALAFLIKKRR